MPKSSKAVMFIDLFPEILDRDLALRALEDLLDRVHEESYYLGFDDGVHHATDRRLGS